MKEIEAVLERVEILKDNGFIQLWRESLPMTEIMMDYVNTIVDEVEHGRAQRIGSGLSDLGQDENDLHSRIHGSITLQSLVRSIV